MNYMNKRIEQSRYLFKRKYRKIRELYAYVFKLKKNNKTRPIMDGFRKNNVNYWVFREIRSIIPHL